MHHFVVEFSKFSSPQAARGIDPANQNSADALAYSVTELVQEKADKLTIDLVSLSLKEFSEVR